MTEQETRIVTLTVEGVKGSSENNDGTTQYQVSANVPEISKYPMPLFVTHPTAPVPGRTYNARLAKGKLKVGKDGQYENNFYWNVVQWDVEGAPSGSGTGTGKRYNASGVVASAAPPANGFNDIDRRRAEDADIFRRKDALKDAIAAIAIHEEKDKYKTALDLAEHILGVAQYLYSWNPSEWDAQAPEPVLQPSEAIVAVVPGKATEIPNQVSVEKSMNGVEFVQASKACGWDADAVMGYLGGVNVIEWTEKNAIGSNFRTAWDACIEAWTQEQVKGLPW